MVMTGSILMVMEILLGFRLLSELYSLLYSYQKEWLEELEIELFPSPLGVIFSLIRIKNLLYFNERLYMFPSPLGVIFSLI